MAAQASSSHSGSFLPPTPVESGCRSRSYDAEFGQASKPCGWMSRAALCGRVESRMRSDGSKFNQHVMHYVIDSRTSESVLSTRSGLHRVTHTLAASATQEAAPFHSESTKMNQDNNIDTRQACRPGYGIRTFENKSYLIPHVLEPSLGAVLQPNFSDALEMPAGVCFICLKCWTFAN